MWQLAVLRVGGHKCSVCGSTKNLTADHIKPRVNFPELFYDVGNGRILCDDCRVRDMLDSWQRGKLKKGRNNDV